MPPSKVPPAEDSKPARAVHQIWDGFALGATPSGLRGTPLDRLSATTWVGWGSVSQAEYILKDVVKMTAAALADHKQGLYDPVEPIETGGFKLITLYACYNRRPTIREARRCVRCGDGRPCRNGEVVSVSRARKGAEKRRL